MRFIDYSLIWILKYGRCVYSIHIFPALPIRITEWFEIAWEANRKSLFASIHNHKHTWMCVHKRDIIKYLMLFFKTLSFSLKSKYNLFSSLYCGSMVSILHIILNPFPLHWFSRTHIWFLWWNGFHFLSPLLFDTNVFVLSQFYKFFIGPNGRSIRPLIFHSQVWEELLHWRWLNGC